VACTDLPDESYSNEGMTNFIHLSTAKKMEWEEKLSKEEKKRIKLEEELQQLQKLKKRERYFVLF
jgi:hypothetical protein